MLGTAVMSNSNAFFGSKGTQTLPVFGWTQKGDLSRWFRSLETLTSKRGKQSWSFSSNNAVLIVFFSFFYNVQIRNSHKNEAVAQSSHVYLCWVPSYIFIDVIHHSVITIRGIFGSNFHFFWQDLKILVFRAQEALVITTYFIKNVINYLNWTTARQTMDILLLWSLTLAQQKRKTFPWFVQIMIPDKWM